MKSLAGSSKLLRAMNSSATMTLLLERGRLTRSDLRALTGLSTPTASEVLRQLADAGLAVLAGHTTGGPGPNAEIYSANPDAGRAAAIAIRETARADRPTLAAAVCDLYGTVVARITGTVDMSRTGAVDVIADQVARIGARAGLAGDWLRHLQLGVPGSYDPETDAIVHIDVPGFGDPGLVAAVADRLSAPVQVDNDVNLAAIAERSSGVAAGAESFALLWFGEGIGLAVDLAGTVLRGAHGRAGEIGYVPLGLAAGADDLQALAGGPAVTALGVEHGFTGTTPAAVVSAAVAGLASETPGAAELVAALAARMAIGITAVAAVLDPCLVVLAGDVSRAGGERLRAAVAAAVRARTPFPTRVEVTGVPGDPVLRGALDSSLRAVRRMLVESLRDSVAAANPRL